MERATRTFTSSLGELAAIRRFVRDECERAWTAADADAIARVELALHEAVANVVLHAYRGAPDRLIELAVETDPARITVTVWHGGADFDPATVSAPPLDGTRDRGYGVYLITQCVDEVRYFREPDGRCRVRLVKNRT